MSAGAAKVLVVEDDDAFAFTLGIELMDRAPGEFEMVRVSSCGEAVDRLGQESFDVGLTDLGLPDQRGLQTVHELVGAAPYLPWVVLTGMQDEDIGLEAVRAGAQDYLAKGELDGRILTRVLRHAMERKATQTARRQSEELFGVITSNVSDLIVVLDREGRRLYNTPSYAPLLGDTGLLVGTESFKDVHPDDRERIRQLFRLTLDTGVGQRAEYRLVRKDGTIRYMESQSNPVRDERGRPYKVVVISRDVTERRESIQILRQALSDLKQSHEALKATQLQLIQSERLEAINTLASGVAQEVKGPLHNLTRGIDYLSGGMATRDPAARTVLQRMETAADQIDQIIQDLVEFSSYQKRETHLHDLNAIIQQALSAVQVELVNHPVRLVLDLAQPLPPLSLDLRTMKHLFINLFMGSIKSMFQGGTLTVKTTSHRVQKTLDFSAEGLPNTAPGNTVVAAQIRDTGITSPGPGLESASANIDLASARQGSRLALTVAQKILNLHGGSLQVCRNPDRGLTITILFQVPAEQRSAPPVLAAA